MRDVGWPLMTRRLAGCVAIAVAAAACGPAPTPSPPPPKPAEVLGLPVVTVSEVLRLAAVDQAAGRVLAVEGWYTPYSAIPCPAPQFEQALLAIRCPDFTAWLTEEPEQVVRIGPTGQSGGAPVGPALHPKVIWPVVAEPPGLDRATWDGHPFPAVLLGHIGDERAERCPPESIEACRDTFVVDRTAWIAGVEPPIDIVIGTEPEAIPDAEEVRAMVAAVDPAATILAMALADADTVRTVEPTADYDGGDPLVYVRLMGDPCPGLDDGPNPHLSFARFFSLDDAPVLERSCPVADETTVP